MSFHARCNRCHCDSLDEASLGKITPRKGFEVALPDGWEHLFLDGRHLDLCPDCVQHVIEPEKGSE